MTFALAGQISRQTKSRDDLADGTLQVLSAGGTVLFSVTLDDPAGTVSGTTAALTFAGFPKVVSGAAAGTAAAARWMTQAGTLYKTVSSEVGSPAVGIPGSGAKIVIDNGAGTLAIGVGDEIEVLAAAWGY